MHCVCRWCSSSSPALSSLCSYFPSARSPSHGKPMAALSPTIGGIYSARPSLGNNSLNLAPFRDGHAPSPITLPAPAHLQSAQRILACSLATAATSRSPLALPLPPEVPLCLGSQICTTFPARTWA